ncbi:MAG: hypothetical protein K6E85_05410 [Lachnospiraceae bacterium]|nr:hypothetical protein [Lachnospiraceae bacterium]
MSKFLKKIIVILVIASSIFLIWGGCIYYGYTFKDSGLDLLWAKVFWMSVQNCMETLLFNPVLPLQDVFADLAFIEAQSSANLFVMNLYTAAMVLAPLVDVLVVFSVLDSFLHFFFGVSFRKRRVLIVGYNEGVRKLITKDNKNNKIYLWTENLLKDEEERELFFKRVTVEMHDFSLGDSADEEEYTDRKKRFNKFITKKKITDVLLMDSSDVKNIQYYMALSSCDICKERTVHFFVLNETLEARRILENYFDNKLAIAQNEAKLRENASDPQKSAGNTFMDLRVFNLERIQAEMLFAELPIYKGCILPHDMDQAGKASDGDSYDGNASADLNVHILLLGANKLSMQILLHAMNQAVLSPTNRIIIDIVDKDLSDFRLQMNKHFNNEFVTDNDDIYEISGDNSDGEFKIRLLQNDIRNDGAGEWLKGLQDEYGQFTYIALCSEDVNECLYDLQIFENCDIIRGDGRTVPLAIRMTYSRDMADYLKSVLKWCTDICFMGDNGEYLGIDRIVNTEQEKFIRAYNASYESITNELIYKTDNNADVDVLWNNIRYYKRESNRALYHHKNVKEHIFGNDESLMNKFWGQTLADDAPDRPGIWSEYLLQDGYEKLLDMAKTEHRRFVYFYASEGWGYSSKKVLNKRLHDCLCNWDKLVKTKPNVLIYDLVSSPLLMNSSR